MFVMVFMMTSESFLLSIHSKIAYLQGIGDICSTDNDTIVSGVKKVVMRGNGVPYLLSKNIKNSEKPGKFSCVAIDWK